jgi:hypothetical protein
LRHFAPLSRPKRRRNRRFPSIFLAQNQRSNRQPRQADRVGLSRPKRLSVTGSEPIIRRPGNQRGRNRKPPRFPRPNPSRRLPRPTANPSRPLSQPASSPRPPPLRTIDRGHGFPRSHGPSEDIVNHQRVNARLMLLRATAAGLKKNRSNFRSEPKLPGRVDRWRMRQVAHFCVTLRHSRDRKDTRIAAFRAFFGPKSAVESPKWRKSLPAQWLTPSLQMLQKCSIVAHQCPIAGRPGNSRKFRQ